MAASSSALLEESKLVEQAALRSSTTKLQPGPGEVFDLGARLLRLPAPAAGPAVASAAPVRPATAIVAAPPAAAAPAPVAAGAAPPTADASVAAPAAEAPPRTAPGMPRQAFARRGARIPAQVPAPAAAPGRRRAARSDARWR